MANTFKSYMAANITVVGNTLYTGPISTQTTMIGLSIANKGVNAVTANAYIFRSGAEYALICMAPIVQGSALVVVGGDQKVVLETGDILRVAVSANGVCDAIVSLLEIT